MRSGRTLALAALLCSSAVSSSAEPRFPLIVSAGTHSLTVPWHIGPVADRLNPIAIAGTEYTVRDWSRFRLYQTANIGSFQHYWWMTGIFVETELGIEYPLPRGFHIDAKLGIGYLHYFWRRKTYELESGEYVEATDWGNPAFLAPLSLLVGYRSIPTGSFDVSPFFSVRWAVQAPFADDAAVMTHFSLLVGARMEWGRTAAGEGR